MLNKLLKYEFKSTARLFLPLYFAVLFFAGINRLLFVNSFFENKDTFNVKTIISIISMFVYVILIVGICVLTLVVVIQRFYKNLLGDEGYLMFTLPVQPWKHILSKLTVSMFWSILSVIIALCSILILSNAPIIQSLPDIFELIGRYFGYAGYFEIPILCLLLLAFSIVLIYAAIALGQLFSKHKLLASFGMYIGLYTVCQIIFAILTALSANTIFMPLEKNSIPTPYDISMFIGFYILLIAILTAGYFALTNFILKKKLNLE